MCRGYGPAHRGRLTAALLVLLTTATAAAQSTQATTAPASQPEPIAAYLQRAYVKSEHMIPMRDGVRLYTSVYRPREVAEPLPVLLVRTPYGCDPYGPDAFPSRVRSPEALLRDGVIFVKQDVRGCFQSEGAFVNMRPHIPSKRGPQDIDESSDTYDTIDWLIRELPANNGRVGMVGISYPGFYCSAGMIDAHPALVAVSPQAPIADWFFDDFFHHGAFFLPHAFNFFASFGKPRPAPTTQWAAGVTHGTPDGYQFFLDLGSLRNVNERWYHGQVAFWDEIAAHPTYDEFWQARNILPHLQRVAPHVLVVGGWFDAEDLYGALNTYRAIERQNPGVRNRLVMGPWAHGDWGADAGDRLGNVHFGEATGQTFRETIEAPFFLAALKDRGEFNAAEAIVFETGSNAWREFDAWPPRAAISRGFYLEPGGGLNWNSPKPPEAGDVFDEFVSDPAKPAPFTEVISIGMTDEYMTDDQRFAGRRPDVLVYRGEPLTADMTFAGPVLAELLVSTSAGDADWVVKLIDEYPPDAADYPGMRAGQRLGGYQMLVRSEVFRGRYRESYSAPRPFTPNEPTRVDVPLQDVLHTFRAGHRIVVQIQSTWFPLVDRNPQRYVENIFEADDADFIRATHRVYRSSRIVAGVIPAPRM